VAVARVELADVVGKIFEFGLGEFMPAGGAEEGGKRFLEDSAVRNIGRDFVPLQGSFIHEGEFSFSGKAEKGSEPLECFDIARRRVYAALDFAPVARIESGLFAKIAQGKASFQAKLFNGVTEHTLFSITLW